MNKSNRAWVGVQAKPCLMRLQGHAHLAEPEFMKGTRWPVIFSQWAKTDKWQEG